MIRCLRGTRWKRTPGLRRPQAQRRRMAQIVETVDRSDHAYELHRCFWITKMALSRAVGGRRDNRRESGFRLRYRRRQRQSPWGRMIHVNPLAGEPLVDRRDLDRASAEAGVELGWR